MVFTIFFKKEETMTSRIFVSVIISLFIAVHGFAGERQVNLLTLEWEPYTGSQMAHNGFVSSVIIQAYKKAGYKVNITFKPWKDTLEIAKKGGADGVFPAYHVAEREASFIFSDEICKSPLGLCKKRKIIHPSPGGGVVKGGVNIAFMTDPRIDQVRALMDLKSYKFGVVKGYANTQEFDAADFLVKVQVLSDEANIAQLLGDKVQLIVIDKYVARNIMIKKFPWFAGEVEFMHPALSLKGLYLAISRNVKNPEEKIQAFNAGLQILKQDGILATLMQQYGF